MDGKTGDFGRNIDGWAGLTDVTLPLGSFFSLTGEFYRGRAVGGLGGGIGQSILISGPMDRAAATLWPGFDGRLDAIEIQTQSQFRSKLCLRSG